MGRDEWYTSVPYIDTPSFWRLLRHSQAMLGCIRGNRCLAYKASVLHKVIIDVPSERERILTHGFASPITSQTNKELLFFIFKFSIPCIFVLQKPFQYSNQMHMIHLIHIYTISATCFGVPYTICRESFVLLAHNHLLFTRLLCMLHWICHRI